VKLYKMSSKVMSIPLVMESNEGGWKWKCELVPRWRFRTLISNVALLTRIWRRTKCYHMWMRRKKRNKDKLIEKWIPSTGGLHCLFVEDYLS
jgi:hypothetical protein